MSNVFRWDEKVEKSEVKMRSMTWSRIVSDAVYLEYFREFLRLNEQRLITLHRACVGCYSFVLTFRLSDRELLFSSVSSDLLIRHYL